MSSLVPDGIIILGNVGGRVVMTSYPTVDPTIAPGVDAPEGSIYMRDTGEIYAKDGAATTDWELQASASSVTAAIAAAVTDPQMLVPPWFWFQDSTSTTGAAYGSTTSYANYLGCAIKPYSSVSPIVQVTTAMSGITWGEFAIAKGLRPTPGTARSLTVVGFADVSAIINSIGTKTIAVPVSGGQSIAPGDHLWVVFAKLSTGTPAFRSTPVADTSDFGYLLNGGNVRPSLIVGTPTNFAAGQTATNLLRMAALTAV